MASSMSPQQYFVTVTLTTTKGRADTRRLQIKQGEPCIVGRASKSAAKDLQPSSSNALFDCPVVSREHAELSVNQWAPAAEQVTIKDTSRHGTRVNGHLLTAGKKMALRPGDELVFGDRIMMGNNVHDGVTVRFHILVPEAENSQAVSPGTHHSTRVFSVPSPSDYDFDSRRPSVDSVIIADPTSSAKTTPEQPKSQPGSAEKPIYLDGKPVRHQPHVIYLDDDDDDDESMPVVKPSQQTVQDSKSRFSANLIPDSLPVAHLPHFSVAEEVAEMAQASKDLARLRNHITGGVCTLGDEGEDSQDLEEEDDVISPASYGSDEDDEEVGPSNSDASDLDGHSDFVEEEEDGAGYTTFQCRKEPSPELGISNHTHPAPPPPKYIDNSLAPVLNFAQPSLAATKPRYDPVRGSPPAPTPKPGFNDAQFRTYRGAEALCGSSWDTPPASNIERFGLPDNDFRFYPTHRPLSPLRASHGFQPLVTSDPLYSPLFGFQRTWDDASQVARFVSPLPPVDVPAPVSEIEVQPAKENKAAMSCPEGIEREDFDFDNFTSPSRSEVECTKGAGNRGWETTVMQNVDDELITQDVAQKRPQAQIGTSCQSANTTLTGSKRKADEMHTGVDASLPAARRRKTIDQSPRNTAAEIAKFATAAVVGGMGTVAFLASPFAERLLQWLA